MRKAIYTIREDEKNDDEIHCSEAKTTYADMTPLHNENHHDPHTIPRRTSHST